VAGGVAGGDTIAGLRRVVSDAAGVIIIEPVFIRGGIVSPSAGAPVKARRGTSM